ncbi:MAG: hypothetical protein RBS57_12695 [Desulforhabdus sp.]|jgi:hypothetical protein|nr:hypothetical protein [Desulforhabdus sp.]
MSDGTKIIDFQEAAKRLGKKRNIQLLTTAITRIERAERVSPQEIQQALKENPDLDYLREKGVDISHISVWLERFPAMSLQELIAILKYAVRAAKTGANDNIIDYLFQPHSSD